MEPWKPWPASLDRVPVRPRTGRRRRPSSPPPHLRHSSTAPGRWTWPRAPPTQPPPPPRHGLCRKCGRSQPSIGQPFQSRAALPIESILESAEGRRRSDPRSAPTEETVGPLENNRPPEPRSPEDPVRSVVAGWALRLATRDLTSPRREPIAPNPATAPTRS